MSQLIDCLRSGRVLLMDGAMGTELFRASVPRDACLEELNLRQPALVQRIHRQYVAAGAQVLLAHTFQSNPAALAKHGLESRLLQINQTALANVLAVAGQSAFVVADIGPIGAQQTPSELIFPMVLSMHGADALLFETCANTKDLGIFLSLKIRDSVLPLEPVLVSFSFSRDAEGVLRTQDRLAPEACARLSRKQGVEVAALGVNCGADIRLPELLEILAAYRSVTDLPLFVRPNAGTPKLVDGQWVYPETPESMAAWLPELFKAGVVMVGGCCGTTPAHIAAFRKVVDEWNRTHDFSSQ
jgi:methionine synthase I (cobalamin-dependent)